MPLTVHSVRGIGLCNAGKFKSESRLEITVDPCNDKFSDRKQPCKSTRQVHQAQYVGICACLCMQEFHASLACIFRRDSSRFVWNDWGCSWKFYWPGGWPIWGQILRTKHMTSSLSIFPYLACACRGKHYLFWGMKKWNWVHFTTEHIQGTKFGDKFGLLQAIRIKQDFVLKPKFCCKTQCSFLKTPKCNVCPCTFSMHSSMLGTCLIVQRTGVHGPVTVQKRDRQYESLESHFQGNRSPLLLGCRGNPHLQGNIMFHWQQTG